MAQIHVVGAGPSGSIAAISALRSGHQVVISEDHPVAGLPENCSGLFSRDGLESLSDFIDYRKFIINPIHGADIHFVDDRMSIRHKSGPVAFVCNRAAFDAGLAARAEAEGARINYNERINDRFHSENIIGADGFLSSVARHFSFGKIPRYASTLQAMVNLRCEDPHAISLFLSNSLFPGFFAWVIPHDEYTAELGVGVEHPNKVFIAWNNLLGLKGMKRDAAKPRGAVIPLQVRPLTAKRIGKRNVLLTGDAAGQVKSSTGGGVIFGGNCAALAGRYVTDPARYEFEWRLRYGPDLAIHHLVHSYLSSLSDIRMGRLGKRLKKLGYDVYLSDYGHMDRPTKMIRSEILIHFLKNIAGGA